MRYYTWTCFNGHGGAEIEFSKDKTPRLCRVCLIKGKKVPIETQKIVTPDYPGQGVIREPVVNE